MQEAGGLWPFLDGKNPARQSCPTTRQGRLRVPVLIGVGAAFDMHAGVKKQAPRWMQRSGLEWLFRLATEPRRLGRRYLINNPWFVWRLLLQSSGMVRHELDLDTRKG